MKDTKTNKWGNGIETKITQWAEENWKEKKNEKILNP